MNLLDTHVLVWAVDEPKRLSRAARTVVDSGDFVVSCASLWEMLLKKGRPTAAVRDPLPWWRTYVMRSGLTVLAIELAHVQQLDSLPGPSTDPIDRILLCQALVNGLRFVTKDGLLRDHYKSQVRVLW